MFGYTSYGFIRGIIVSLNSGADILFVLSTCQRAILSVAASLLLLCSAKIASAETISVTIEDLGLSLIHI